MIGIVYKIEINNEIYIGSTIDKLNKRQRNHNITLKENIKKYKLYDECRKYNITKIICITLEKKEIENEEEIRLLEQEYIDKLQPTLNCNSAYTGLTQTEYNKNYKKNNIEKIRELKKKWRDNNKEYYIEYNKKHKESINVDRTKKIKCDVCDKFVSKRNISTHKKTKKCLQAKCF